jgi:serine phosphatase RsbU (regulator of sigma subunit)
MEQNDSTNLFAESTFETELETKGIWKILIVDDEKDIHTVIKLAMDEFSYLQKNVVFLDAYSGQEAIEIINQNPDIALVLLDVVMESDDAGLRLVEFIRKEIKNDNIQIVLWTGQPGKAPKKDVVMAYEINDYKTKTELNDDNIFTTVFASLRAFDTIMSLDNFRKTLEDKVVERTNEVVKQKKRITDSIQYALHIQKALLPSEESIKRLTDEFFIFYRPKDIVSGDFFWMLEHDSYIFFAAVDCTGHGVPGAFMSMIGNTLLNETVREKRIYDPSEILETINKSLRFTLLQGGKENSAHEDGMEISLIRYNKKFHHIVFAGAGHSILLAHKDKNIVIEGNPSSIGGIFLHNSDIQFENIEIPIEEETIIYLFSDGYKDQFGGPKIKKYGSKNFENLLSKIKTHSIKKQEQFIAKEFDQWKGDQKQVDDIMVIGLKFNAN